MSEEKKKITKEKTADEMFEELGYRVRYYIHKDEVTIIGYTDKDEKAEECPIIFLKNSKLISTTIWIDLKLLKAINKKCEELEWL